MALVRKPNQPLPHHLSDTAETGGACVLIVSFSQLSHSSKCSSVIYKNLHPVSVAAHKVYFSELLFSVTGLLGVPSMTM
ncbi:TPA: hypothetical protein ACGTRQ_005057 [Vibrio parahaemolyticus]